MCGRFFWNNDAEEAFEEDFPELVRIARLQEKLLKKEEAAGGQEKLLRNGDYTPAMNALAVVCEESAGGETMAGRPVRGTGCKTEESRLSAEFLKWGFPGFDKGKLLINARAESVRTRPTFAESFMLRRCVLPAAGFYEWDKKKNKVTFRRSDRPILYLAGIYRPENRFVVLTREANASMLPVHDRMPLILDKDEVEPWVRDVSAAGSILTKELPQLIAERPYEQISFEW